MTTGDPVSAEAIERMRCDADAALTLRCRRHHTLTHTNSDWRIVMIRGIPHTIAPAWLDPSQTPRRNTAHDPP